MGDLSAEPSMEDILSSIKRIIAEEGEGPTRQRRQRPPAAAPVADADGDDAVGSVLELSNPIPQTPSDPAPAARDDETKASSVRAKTEPPAEPIVSQQAVDASRGALDTLSRLMVKPEPGSDGTLESLVREMLRPMLREWLDAHLPDMVEQMVAREIARIAGQA